MARKKDNPETDFIDAPAAPEKDPVLAELDRLREENAALLAKLDAARTPPPAPPPKLMGDASLPLWRVRLVCPTPLHFPVLEIHAADSHQAKMEFCRQNGISDSIHKWDIERVVS